MRLTSLFRNTSRACRPNRTQRRDNRVGHRPQIEVLEGRWLPSTLTVTSAADSGPGSLRSEIAAAQSGDTIVFDPSLAGQAINLTSGELVINKSLTIDGTTINFEVINTSGNSRVFDVTSASANVTLDALGITGGSAKNGGGIMNVGSLTLNSCSVENNAASGKGGAIDNKGTMVIYNCPIDGNIAVNGGAIENEGTMTVTDSGFGGDGATRNGGGIENQGTLTFDGSGCGGCFAWNAGGGIANFGTLYVTGSGFGGCLSVGGGAIANFGDAVLDSTIISACYGGVVNTGTMSISNCTLSDCLQNSPRPAGGGGIYNTGTMTVTGSTITGDFGYVQGGGIFNSGTLTLSATTVTGNQAFSYGQAQGQGGGIYNSGTLYVTNGSNVTGNTAAVGADVYSIGTLFISSDSTVGEIAP